MIKLSPPHRIQLLLFFAIITFYLQAQNLVPNPSFENNSGCPNLTTTYSIVEDWYNPTNASPDYFNSCYTGPMPGFSVPTNLFSYQPALTGQGYSGIYVSAAGGGNSREYIQIALSSPLIAGACYQVEMNASPANFNIPIAFGISHLGMLFTVNPPTVTPPSIFYATPQAYYTEAVTDTVNWTQLSETFIAAGGEQYLTIGNFAQFGTYEIVALDASNTNTSGPSYYYIEDVKVELAPGGLPVSGSICPGECFVYAGQQFCTPGTYQVAGTGGCSSTTSVTVTMSNPAIANIAPADTLFCDGSPIILDASTSSSGAGVEYNWSGPNGFFSTLQNPAVLEAGAYTLTVSGDDLCDAQAIVEVTEIDNLEIMTSVSGIIDCNNSSVNLTGVSNISSATFHWTGSGINSNSPIVSVNAVGEYYLEVNTPNGCIRNETVTVLGDFLIPDISITGNNILDCNNTSLTLTGSSFTPNVLFSWSGPGVSSNLSTITVNQEGTYTLIVTGENGCVNVETISVVEVLDLPDISAEAQGELDCNNSTVSLVGNSNTPNVSFLWTGPGINANTSNTTTNQIGEYTLTVTASNGCTSTQTVNVIQNADVPDISAEAQGILDCNNSTVTLVGNSNTPNVSFLWNGPSVNANTSNTTTNQEGEYTLTVTADNGCTSTQTVNVIQNADVPDISAEVQGVLDCNNSTITLVGNSNTPNVSFLWNGPSVNANTSNTTTNQEGEYTLTVTADNGCTSTQTVSVIQNADTPDISAEVQGILDCNNSTITLVGNSNTPNVSFLWNGPSVNANTSNTTTNQEGEYTLTVTADNGCTSTQTVNVIQNADVPDISAEVQGVLDCNNSTVTLVGNSNTPNVSFLWNGPSVNANTSNTTTNQEGEYTLTVTAYNGCTSTQTVTVIQNSDVPDISAEVQGILDCNNSTVTLVGNSNTPNVSFLWNGPGLNANTSNTTTNQAGEYTLTVTADNGCTSTETVNVIQNADVPDISAEVQGILDCNNSTVTLSGNSNTPNVSFIWNGPSVNANTSNTTTNQEGEYTLTVTADNGCTSTQTVTVIQNADVPDISTEVQGILDCNNSTVTLVGNSNTPNVSFLWNGPGLNANTSNTTTNQAGEYTLTVTADNGCTSTETVNVIQNSDVPDISAEVQGILDCNNSTVTLVGNSNTPNVSFLWNGPSVNTNTSNTTTNQEGEYTLTVTTDNGCTSTQTVTVIQNADVPDISAEVQGVLDCNNSTVSLAGNSNTPNVSFIWNGPGVNANSSNTTTNQEGEYTLTVTADNGCTSTQTVNVIQNADVPDISAEVQGILNCNNSTVTLVGNSNTPNVSFLWNGPSVNANTSNTTTNQEGEYTLTVTANNGCIADTIVLVEENLESPNIEILPIDTLTCITLSVNLDASNSNGTGLLNYEWQDSNGIVLGTNPILNTSNSGNYLLIISNQNNGCTEINTVTVEQNLDTPIANAGNNGVLTCDVNEVILDGSGSMGNNLSFQWENAAQVLIAEQAITQVAESGIYTLIVTNSESGCSAQSDVEIIPDDNLPTAIASTNGMLTCTINSAILDGSNSSTISGNIEYEWTDNLGNIISSMESTTVNSSGIYTLEITDGNNGCSTSSTIEVEENISQPIADAGQNQTLICGQSDLILDGTATGDHLIYEWQNENGITIATSAITFINSGGDYFLIVTDTLNGCSATDEVEIIPDTNLPIADAGNDETLTCNITQILLNGSASSSGNNIQYQWQNSAGNIIATTPTTTVSLPDTYILYVLDIDNNCQTQDEVIINENINEPTIVIDFISEQILTCDNSSLVLDASGSLPIGNINYQWTTTNGIILSGGNTANPEIGQSGSYTLTITNTLNGCSNTESIEILENITPPTVTINPTENLTCTVESIQIDATSSSSNGNYIYSWSSNPLGGILTGGNTLQPTVNQAGTYTLMIINNDNGCQNEAQILVNENTIPPLAVASNTEQFDCLTESINLSGQGSSEGISFTYEWFGNSLIDDANTLFPTIYSAGNYTLVVTNIENGCTNSSEIFIEENENIPTSTIIETIDPLCYGDQGSLTILSVDGGEAPYLYSIDGGQNFTTSANFTNLAGGNYLLVIQDAAGCQLEEEVIIEPILSELFVQLESDQYLELGDDYQLLAFTNIDTSQIAQINWVPSDGLSCTNCLNPIVENIINEIEYTITVINNDGCEASDQIILQVNPTKEIYIPNAFSPNDDGFNDVFMIYADIAKVKQVNTFQIYDRWGAQVFSAQNFSPNNPAVGWDGKFKTKQLNSAVFIYFAEIEFIDGKIEVFKGDVTLIRNN